MRSMCRTRGNPIRHGMTSRTPRFERNQRETRIKSIVRDLGLQFHPDHDDSATGNRDARI